MPQKTIYFAHPMCDYGTEREASIIEFLENRGYTVINPAEYQGVFQSWMWISEQRPLTYVTQGHSVEFPAYNGTNKMDFWVTLAKSCDECAFCAFESTLDASNVPAGTKEVPIEGEHELTFTVPTNRIGAGVWKEVEGLWQDQKPTLFIQVEEFIDFEDIGLENPPITLKLSSQPITKWSEDQVLLTIEQTKALLRASGRYSC